MRINRRTTLFFDASVLVAGSHSPAGGSGLLLAACKAGGFQAQTSAAVVAESIGALEQMSAASLARFYRLLVEIRWQFLDVPMGERLKRYRRYIDAKDVHVLAAAVEGKSQFLLTLDRQHILAAVQAVSGAGLAITILTPGDFIQHYYPQHEDFPKLPPSRH